LRAVVLVLGLALAAPASAATLAGVVYEDTNGDGLHGAGEPGVPNVVVCAGQDTFLVTDANGNFQGSMDHRAFGIVWARVPDGFVPGPRWGFFDVRTPRSEPIAIALRRVSTPTTGPVTFVVASDTHMVDTQEIATAADLSNAAMMATQLDPAPAFFTILGDITQGNRPAEFELVDGALEGLDTPYIPVPGNHDWYDGGTEWFRHYGPDNYSFDIGNAHFVVWNMAMSDVEIRTFLGAELERVAPGMTVITLTHEPPSPFVLDALRDLGVDYVLTGHTHSNRVVDHGGMIELNHEPMLMGGLDFTPGGYRVMTFDGQRVTSYHRTVVDEPLLSLTAPLENSCVPATGGKAYVAAELDGGSANVIARINDATPIAGRAKGGWTYEIELPVLTPGTHVLHVTATSATGTRVAIAREIDVCGGPPPPLPAVGWDWAQLGGGPSHRGSRTHELAPPLTMRWAAPTGGHVLTAPPLISGGVVYVAVTDLADGNAGGVVAFDLATGAQRWRATTPFPLRGGIAIADSTVIAPLVDGTVLGIDSASGTVRWKQEISRGFPPQAGAIFSPPTTDFDDVLVGHQRTLAAFTARSGDMLWHDDPVPQGVDSQSAAAVAIYEGIAVGTFNRAFGGVIAWDRYTGKRLWSVSDGTTIAINASPVIDNDTIYFVNGSDVVVALDHVGQVRWRKRLDPDGFEWGNATIGTPALAKDILVVPTLYSDLVGMNALTGAELWRFSGRPGPIRTTHYRGGGQSGFAASPVITGDIVWAADTSGMLSAVELSSGRLLWQTDLGVPALAGLAVSRDWLVVATYDGTVRALVPIKEMCTENSTVPCLEPPPPNDDSGCCSTTKTPVLALVLALFTLGAVTRRRRR